MMRALPLLPEAYPYGENAVNISRNLVVLRKGDERAERVAEVACATFREALSPAVGARMERLAAVARRVAILRFDDGGEQEWLDLESGKWERVSGVGPVLDRLRGGSAQEDEERALGILLRRQALTMHYLVPLSEAVEHTSDSLHSCLRASMAIESNASLGRVYRLGWLLPPEHEAAPHPDITRRRFDLFRAAYDRATDAVEGAYEGAARNMAMERLGTLAHVWLLVRDQNYGGSLLARHDESQVGYCAAGLLAFLTTGLYSPEPDLPRKLFMVDGSRWRPLQERVATITLRRVKHPYGTLRDRMHRRLVARLVHDGLLAARPWQTQEGEGTPAANTLDFERSQQLRAAIAAEIREAMQASSANIRQALDRFYCVEAAPRVTTAKARRPRRNARRQAPQQHAIADSDEMSERMAAEALETATRIAALAEGSQRALSACQPGVLGRVRENKRADAVEGAAADLVSIVEGSMTGEVDGRTSQTVGGLVQADNVQEAVRLAVSQERRLLREKLLTIANRYMLSHAGSAAMLGSELERAAGVWLGYRHEIGAAASDALSPERKLHAPGERPSSAEYRRVLEEKRPSNPALLMWMLILAVFLAQLLRPVSLALPAGLLNGLGLGFMVSGGWERWLLAVMGGVLGAMLVLLYWARLHVRSMRAQQAELVRFATDAADYWQRQVTGFTAEHADWQVRDEVRGMAAELGSWQDALRSRYTESPASIRVLAPGSGDGWELEPMHLSGPLSYYEGYPSDAGLSYELAQVQRAVRDRMLEGRGKWRLLELAEGERDRDDSLRLLDEEMHRVADEAVAEALRPVEELDAILDRHEELLDNLQVGALPPRVPGKQPPEAYLTVPTGASELTYSAERRGLTSLPALDPDHVNLLYLQYGAFSTVPGDGLLLPVDDGLHSTPDTAEG